MFYYIKQGFSNLLNIIPLNQGSCFHVLPGDKHKTNIGKIVKIRAFLKPNILQIFCVSIFAGFTYLKMHDYITKLVPRLAVLCSHSNKKQYHYILIMHTILNCNVLIEKKKKATVFNDILACIDSQQVDCTHSLVLLMRKVDLFYKAQLLHMCFNIGSSQKSD